MYPQKIVQKAQKIVPKTQHFIKRFRTALTGKRTIRLLIYLDKIPSIDQIAQFHQELGNQHLFLTASTKRDISFQSNNDYVYEPGKWSQIASFNHLRNALLYLSYIKADYVCISHSLEQFPIVGGSHLNSQIIYSVKAKSKYDRGLLLKGKVLRLLPVQESTRSVNITNLNFIDDPFLKTHSFLTPLNTLLDESPVRCTYRGKNTFPSFSKKKKLIFVFPIFLTVGGVERNTIEIIKQLKKQYDFVIINFEKLSKEQGSLHHQYEGNCEAIYDLHELFPQNDFPQILEELKSTYHPDAVWICNGCPWLARNAAKLRAIFKDIPIIDQEVYDTKEGWINEYNNPGIRAFDQFIAVTEKIKRTFIEKYKINRNQISLIYPAFSDEKHAAFKKAAFNKKDFLLKYKIPHATKYIAFIGRMADQKQPLTFLEFARSTRSDHDTHYIMVGDGPLGQQVDAMISQQKLTNVTRIPFLDNVFPVLDLSCGLIITSKYEGLPIVMLESLTMGIPVLSTDVGDIALLITRYHCGILYNPIMGISISKHINTFIENLPQLSANARKASPLIQKEFAAKTIAAQYAKLWDTLINNRNI
ncbi:glycosyltransferase family 4 protein [Candidatus Roizmanbacteria bacterium]|nr:glycosyltransferase family 4 protein [Candidatus Roizmanbacteria bacterium]